MTMVDDNDYDDEGEEGSICLAGEIEEDDELDDIHEARPRSSRLSRGNHRSSRSDRHHHHQHHDDNHGSRSPDKPSSQRKNVRGTSSRVKSKAATADSDERPSSLSSVTGDASATWGNASISTITLKDLMGGEKNATEVEKILNGPSSTAHQRSSYRHHYHNSPTKGGSSGSVAGAEAKKQAIMKSKRVKEGRRSNIKSSLDSFLQAKEKDNSEGGDFLEAEDVEEDESLISDEEEAHQMSRSPVENTVHHRRRFRAKGSGENDDDGDDENLENSSVSKSHSTKRLGRTTRTIDANSGSSHSRRTMMIHRRNQRSSNNNRSTDVNDDASVGSHKSRRSTRTSMRSDDCRSLAGDDENRSRRVRRDARSIDRSTRDARSVERGQNSRSVDASSRHRRRSHSRGADSVRDASSGAGGGGGGRSRSQSRGDDGNNNQAGAKIRRHRSRSRGGGDADDDQSVMSRKSTATSSSSRRGRRPSRPRHAKQSNRLPPSHATTSHAATTNNNKLKSPINHQLKSPTKGQQAPSKASLAKHLASEDQNSKSTGKDLEEASETSSRDKSQVVLLQFDPTNANLVQTVNQAKCKKTSEIIRHADGTESELQISELAGLPTFEKNSDPNFHDSAQSGMSYHEATGQASSRSLGSLDAGSSVEGGHKKQPSFSRSSRRPTSNKSFSESSSARTSQIPGEPASEGGGRRTPSRAKSTTAVPRQRGLQATKSFIMRMNRSRGQINHQALDDNGSDEE